MIYLTVYIPFLNVEDKKNSRLLLYKSRFNLLENLRIAKKEYF
jgi:hypothetical protein